MWNENSLIFIFYFSIYIQIVWIGLNKLDILLYMNTTMLAGDKSDFPGFSLENMKKKIYSFIIIV